MGSKYEAIDIKESYHRIIKFNTRVESEYML